VELHRRGSDDVAARVLDVQDVSGNTGAEREEHGDGGDQATSQ
jgi:hypothetical protein